MLATNTEDVNLILRINMIDGNSCKLFTWVHVQACMSVYTHTHTHTHTPHVKNRTETRPLRLRWQ